MNSTKLKRISAIILSLALLASIALPTAAYAKRDENKTVRVGWFDSSYNSLDESGRRSGYSYEYQLKLSAYNGWQYEYVDGSWSDLFQMLIDGEIDLMSDISYTEERSELMLYPNLPMGTEEYYLFVAAGNEDLSASDYNSFYGKKIGVNKNSYQAGLYEKWVEENNIKAETVLLTTTEDESLQMMEDGEIDGYVTVDAFMDPTKAAPVVKIGSSDYYFAVSNSRPDLLADLNYAMNKIQDEDRYYNQRLFEKFIKRAGANAFLTDQETRWLEYNKTIRVGYQDNYLAFCAKDDKTGELKGVLKDYLALASDVIPNSHINFESIAYESSEAAFNALQKGEIDCVFPANLNGYEADSLGVVTTPAMLNTSIYAIVRTQEPNIFSDEETIKVAVNKNNPNYDAVLAEKFPKWEKVYFNDTKECLKAISQDKADCLLISNYRYNNLSKLCSKYHLTSVSTGKYMDYCIAVTKGNTVLYSILAKTTALVPDSSINASLAQYVTEDAKLTFVDYLNEYMPIFLAITVIIAIIILALLIQNINAVKRARRLISATETDELTGLYTRKYFFQYANRVYRRHPDRPMDAIVLNIEQFRSVNDIYGRDVGDRVLQALGNEIKSISDEMNGIAGRFESDRFDIYISHTENYRDIFNRIQNALDNVQTNANIRIRMGVMPWSEELEPVQLFDRARTACNMARGSYGEHLVIYDNIVNERENYESRLINDLKHGLENREFKVYYQPKFDIQNDPEKIVGAEALVRWEHPVFGLIPPVSFIPLFEKNGQIALLDRYVWNEVAKQISLWKEKHSVVIPVSINLSRVDVYDENLAETLEEILNKNNLGHDALMLEVTESAYTENSKQVIKVVEALRDIGYKFEMDDFGTGYSSLNMLSEMPIDGIKMDRGFILNIEDGSKDFHMVALILDIAKNLGVPVIAEGVETKHQLELLKKLGCEMVQGYWFSKPIPADEFEEKFLNN